MKTLFKNKSVLLFAIIAFSMLISSCGKWGVGTPQAQERTFLHGECLKSAELIYDESKVSTSRHTFKSLIEAGVISPDIEVSPFPDSPIISMILELDMDKKYDRIGRFLDKTYRYVPGDEVYNSFGPDAGRIKEEYEKVYNELDFVAPMHSYTTVYYEKGLELTADKDFAGHKAGDDLSSLVYVGSWGRNYELHIPGIKHVKEVLPLESCFSLNIPVGNFELVDETISFNLTMPVKAAMYLTLLNNRISNPEAELQYKNEILSCSFTIHKGLR